MAVDIRLPKALMLNLVCGIYYKKQQNCVVAI